MSYPGGGPVHDNPFGSAPLVTGDAVVLELRPAGFATRAVALFIDILLQGILLVALGMLGSWMSTGLDEAALAALTLGLSVLVLVGYPTAFETLSRGRSLGKLALGLRVVGTDGSPERFRQALGRALMSVVEVWMTTGVVALITSLINRDGRRLGDFAAGTTVVEERTGRRRNEAITMPPQLAGWAANAELSGLSSETAADARQYVLRYDELAGHTRHELGVQLAEAVAAQVSPPPPPGTSPPYFLAAVLAERRRRGTGSEGGNSVQETAHERFPGGRFPI